MEGGIGLSIEQKTLIDELCHGMETAKRLKIQLRTDSSAGANDVLAQQIVSSFEKALLMLNWTVPTVQQPQLPPNTSSGAPPESPPSINGSPRSDDADAGVRDSVQDYNINSSKKRKTLPRWTEQVRISPERGLEGPQDDGYSWRKYGQKDILGAKYPRSYYRCTYRNTQNCWATKQVQRSDDDPTVFEVSYKGKHTCAQVISASASPEKRQTKPKHNATRDVRIFQNDILQNQRNNPTVNTDWLEQNNYNRTEMTRTNGFPSQTTPTPTPFQSPPLAANTSNGFGRICHTGFSEPSDFAGLMPANTSSSSSPMFDVDFPIDTTAEIDANYPFDNTTFFY